MGRLIKLSKSNIGFFEIINVIKILKRSYLGMGKEVQKFEKKLSDFFGREVVCVSSGTSAIQLAIEACQFNYGDEILVPSFTYIATIQAISAAGMKPIFCDINSNNLIIDLEDAKSRITPKTRAILPVFFSGGVGDIDSIYEFAKSNELRVIEDAAHSFGTKHKGKFIGGLGDITCFSFDGIKNITSGEGGCVVTNDSKIIDLIKNKRLLGVINDTEKRFNGQRSWEFDVKYQGWRYHMSDIMAAIGCIQLKRLKHFSTKRQQYARLYDELFENTKEITPLKHDYSVIVPHIYVIKVPYLINRDHLREHLRLNGVEVGYHYFPNHLLSLFKTDYKLPKTEEIYKSIISLPLHTLLTKKDIVKVAKLIIEYIDVNQ